MTSYDLIGNIAIIKKEIEGRPKSRKQKIAEAKQLLKQSNIKTVLEKASEIKGRLRTFKTHFIAGQKTKETIHKENKCKFKLNVESCYFSPRIGNERKKIAEKIKKKDNVLVMFSGIACYPIVIHKISKPESITAIEISKTCNYYAKENLKLNNIPKSAITLIQGDVKKKMPSKKFDVIVMTRPNLKTTFLEQALKVSKKRTKIIYYGFCKEKELPDLKKSLVNEAKIIKRRIKILRAVKAGETAPYKIRYRIEIIVL